MKDKIDAKREYYRKKLQELDDFQNLFDEMFNEHNSNGHVPAAVVKPKAKQQRTRFVLRPEYQGMLLPEAMETFMQKNITPVSPTEIVREMFGQYSKARRSRVTFILWERQDIYLACAGGKFIHRIHVDDDTAARLIKNRPKRVVEPYRKQRTYNPKTIVPQGKHLGKRVMDLVLEYMQARVGQELTQDEIAEWVFQGRDPDIEKWKTMKRKVHGILCSNPKTHHVGKGLWKYE